jgi:hypothetical protein
VNNELDGMWQEAVIAQFEVFQHIAGELMKIVQNHSE